MPHKVEKFLRKLGSKGRTELEVLLARITSGDFEHLGVKKLGGFENRYRIRVGDIRIQYSLDEIRRAMDIEVDWKSDNTYRS